MFYYCDELQITLKTGTTTLQKSHEIILARESKFGEIKLSQFAYRFDYDEL